MQFKGVYAVIIPFLCACGTDPGTTSGDLDTAVTTLPDGGTATTSADGAVVSYTGYGAGDGGITYVAEGASNVCQKLQVDTGRVTPDMMIVLDRSGSMKNRGVNRWDPSVAGLKAITASTEDAIRFGLMAYPGTGGTSAQPAVDCSTITDLVQQISCFAMSGSSGGGGTCSAGHVDVPIAATNAQAIARALDGMQPGGSTPTAATLEAAHQSLGSGAAPLNPDVRNVSAKYVLLVTDGAPNCTGGSTGGGQDAAAVAASVAAIKSMADDGIKTYVLGYDAQNDPTLAAALDMMAAAGGTGDAHYRPINDQASLQQEFSRIAGSAARCEYALAQAPRDPSFVRVTQDGATLAFGDANGWVISADRMKITLQGAACELMRGTELHALSVEVECERVTLG
jgi:hypothetical protein